MDQISIIIPTLNESVSLPHLLDALAAQTRRPDEIIVADAGSQDGTANLARTYGVRVVPGGLPGPGRNAGARAAGGNIFLFLDADVLPGPDFLALALEEFNRKGFCVATCPTEALSDELGDKIIMEATNLYLQAILPISPRAPGFCIFATRAAHEAIQGFDETLRMSEDHDYVRRAARIGKFGLLTGVRIPVSMRRLQKEGIVGLALKYFWCEMYALAGKPIRTLPFEYEFGAFEEAPVEKGVPLVDVGELRRFFGDRFGGLLQQLSRDGLANLKRLVDLPYRAPLENFRLFLEGPDMEALDAYFQERLALLRHNRHLNYGMARIRSFSQETIRFLLSDGEIPPAVVEERDPPAEIWRP